MKFDAQLSVCLLELMSVGIFMAVLPLVLHPRVMSRRCTRKVFRVDGIIFMRPAVAVVLA
ncbi:MAG: hypothetical protein ACI4R9_00330 [Kiritimatiellia bacterium]